jgi:hypothetical protein
MNIERISILSVLFVLFLGMTSWADEANTIPEVSDHIKTGKLEGVNLFHRIGAVGPISRVMTYYDFVHQTLRDKLQDLHTVKESNSLNPDFGPSIWGFDPAGGKSLEGGRAVTFEIIQSRFRRKEMFMSLHLAFNPRAELVFLEMQLTPSSEKGINLLIPFLRDK